jgi:hypothetical protein
MTNRSKNIGTAVESAVTRFAQGYGFAHAERRALHGSLDRGDILLCPGVIVEAKGGATAETASDNLIGSWLAETERERVNANAAVALLVCKRRAVGATRAGQWAAWTTVGMLRDLVSSLPMAASAPAFRRADVEPIRMTLVGALTLLRAAGYGDPL